MLLGIYLVVGDDQLKRHEAPLNRGNELVTIPQVCQIYTLRPLMDSRSRVFPTLISLLVYQDVLKDASCTLI